MFEKTIDKEVLEVISRLYSRESPFVILDTLRGLVKDKGIRKRINAVEERIIEGESLISALRNEKLISENVYEYLKGAEDSRNLDAFAKEKLKIDKQVKKIVRELIFSLLSPSLAFVISLGVIYIFIYRVLPAFQLKERQLSLLPSYFPYLIDLSKNPQYYLMFVLAIFSTLFFLYINRRRIPGIKTVFLMYERLKLYIHLYLSIKSGYNIDEALRKYKGALEGRVNKILQAIEEGEDIVDTFLEVFKDINPLERPLLLSAIKTAAEEDLKDLQQEVMEMLKVKLEVLKQAFTVTSLILVAMVILFAYGGILMPIMKAMRSSMM